MDFVRIFRHLLAEGSARRHFPPATLDAIQRSIAAGEQRHRGQLCFAVEGALPLADLWHGRTPRERALDVFARLHVWDTEHNSGVLIYVQLVDRAIEIVADRGIATRLPDAVWKDICTRMQTHFAAQDFERGAVQGVIEVSDLLVTQFPSDGTAEANELPDRPVVL
jgi:uncharacterized membrane protein